MEAVAAGVVAVLGTLLGAALNHLLERRTARQADLSARSERLRAERIEAYCALGGALTNYRRAQMDLWFTRHDHPDRPDLVELRREEQRLRSAALEALFRVELLTDDETLIDKGRAALSAIDGMDCTDQSAQMSQARSASRALIYDFIRAAKPFVRDEWPASVERSAGPGGGEG
ncbi:hypothetical protein [Nonomuraea sp. NPDC050643]|uniref:hypothetical protein n=1 Tax=Nonomuraea sp. NPDC050643 TaxID=3155660 RepID=UPI0033C045DF